jgi:hypothetical protein
LTLEISPFKTALSKIEEIFLSKPSHARFRVWYNVDENVLDKHTMRLISESISRFQEHIYKIAFIGFGGFTRRKFDHIAAKTMGKRCITKAYFTDAEISERVACSMRVSQYFTSCNMGPIKVIMDE